MEPLPSMAQNFCTPTLSGTKLWPKSIPLLAQNPKNSEQMFILANSTDSFAILEQNLTYTISLAQSLEKPYPFWHTFGFQKPYPLWHTA